MTATLTRNPSRRMVALREVAPTPIRLVPEMLRDLAYRLHTTRVVFRRVPGKESVFVGTVVA